jgi:hypothetical protein
MIRVNSILNNSENKIFIKFCECINYKEYSEKKLEYSLDMVE